MVVWEAQPATATATIAPSGSRRSGACGPGAYLPWGHGRCRASRPDGPPRPPRAAARGAPHRAAPPPVRGRGGRLRAGRIRRGERRGDLARGGHVEGDVLRALRQQGGVHPRALRRGGDRGHARDGRRRPTTRATPPTRSAWPPACTPSWRRSPPIRPRRRRCSCRSSAPGPAPPRAATRSSTPSPSRSTATTSAPRRSTSAPTFASPDDAFAIIGASVELVSRSLRTGRPADVLALEPVITRLMLGVLQRA